MKGIELKPLLSVVIPIYNVEPYLSRCLESVLNQSYVNLEVICVDDGSTDQSGSIADRYAARDNRIRVLHKGNGGLVSARKAGLEQATGRYATYVDSDDWIEQGMYEDLMEMMLGHEADLVTSDVIRDYGSHIVIEKETVPPNYYGEDILAEVQKRFISTERFFERGISGAVWNKIYRSDILRECQREIDDRISVGEDVALVYSYVLNIETMVVSGRHYYHYCMRNDSVMGRRTASETKSVTLMLDYVKVLFQRKCEVVPNLEIQFDFLYAYFQLLKETESIVQYRNGILYPFGEIAENSSVIVYGTGRFGEALLKLLENRSELKVVGWGDGKKQEGMVGADEIMHLQYDKIIIAILIADIADAVEQELVARGIPQSKIMRIDVMLIREVILWGGNRMSQR